MTISVSRAAWVLLLVFLPVLHTANAQPAGATPSAQDLREVFNNCVATCTPIQLERDATGFAKTDAYLFETFCACQCARITSRMTAPQFYELRGFVGNGKPLIQLPWYVELSHKAQKACTKAISEE